MPNESQLIQPLLSTEAYSLLRNVIPSDTSASKPSASPLTSRSNGISRYRQVLATAIPLAAADLLAICASYLLATVVAGWFFESHYHRGVINNLTAFCLCHLMVGNFLGLYPATGVNPVCELRSLLTTNFSSLILLVALNGLVGEVSANELVTFTVTIPLIFLLAPISRFTTRRIVSRQKWWGERGVIVGGGKHGRLVHEFIRKQPQRGLKLIGIVDDNPNEYWITEEGSSFEYLGQTADLVNVCRERGCHWAIAAVADKTEQEVVQILTQGSLIPNLVVLNNNVLIPSMWVEPFDAAGFSGFHIRDRLLFPMQRLSKRAVDIAISALALIAAIPFFLVTAIWIKIASPGPVFFCHNGRLGRSGKPFGAWKIRTMVPNAALILDEYLNSNPEAMAEWQRDQKLKNDPRIIPGIGAFLRKTSLDELPQLWNVLTGDMSLVGPRPIVGVEVTKYGETFHMYNRVRPGLTGLWQVSGRNNTSYNDRVQLDNYYVRNWSMWLDYFILLRTVRTVLLREGSY